MKQGLILVFGLCVCEYVSIATNGTFTSTGTAMFTSTGTAMFTSAMSNQTRINSSVSMTSVYNGTNSTVVYSINTSFVSNLTTTLTVSTSVLNNGTKRTKRTVVSNQSITPSAPMTSLYHGTNSTVEYSKNTSFVSNLTTTLTVSTSVLNNGTKRAKRTVVSNQSITPSAPMTSLYHGTNSTVEYSKNTSFVSNLTTTLTVSTSVLNNGTKRTKRTVVSNQSITPSAPMTSLYHGTNSTVEYSINTSFVAKQSIAPTASMSPCHSGTNCKVEHSTNTSSVSKQTIIPKTSMIIGKGINSTSSHAVYPAVSTVVPSRKMTSFSMQPMKTATPMSFDRTAISMKPTSVDTGRTESLPTESTKTTAVKTQTAMVMSSAVDPSSSIEIDFSTTIKPTPTTIMYKPSLLPTTPKSLEPLVLQVSLKFSEKIFHEDLYDKESVAFLKTKIEVEKEIEMAYNETANFVSVTITAFRPGSIISEGRLYFENSTEDDVDRFQDTLKDYGTRNGFIVEKFKPTAGEDDDDDDDDVILGLNWWQIGVIIAGVVAFILLIIVIVLCCKISRGKRRAKAIMAPYNSSPYYDVIGEGEEMKSLRASPSRGNAGIKDANGNADAESGGRSVNMYSSSSLNDAKNDGLVNQTTSKMGKDNPAADVHEYDYVTITDASADAGGVLKL